MKCDSIKTRCGFSLIELVVVILVVGMITSWIIIRINSFYQDSCYSATYTHIQRLAKLAEIYHARNGSWPRDAYPGIIPLDLMDMCQPSDFGESPFGAYYDWNGPHGTTSPYYGIAIVGWNGKPMVPHEDMQEMDNRFDDGNLSAGTLQKVRVGSHWTLHYILAVRN